MDKTYHLVITLLLLSSSLDFLQSISYLDKHITQHHFAVLPYLFTRRLSYFKTKLQLEANEILLNTLIFIYEVSINNAYYKQFVLYILCFIVKLFFQAVDDHFVSSYLLDKIF